MTAHNQLHFRTSFGVKDGRILAPAEVMSGLACGCHCPECGAQLVAKKGPKNIWHFAHHNVIATQACVESAIHAAAKQVLLDANWLRVPEKFISVTGLTAYGFEHAISRDLSSSRIIRFDYSREEIWETNLRPDVVGYRGDRRMFVEMYFTHQVDKAKLRKLEEMALPAIEINLSNLEHGADFEAIRQRVLHDTVEKEWLFYPGLEAAKVELRVTLNAEIAQMNHEHERKLEAQRRKEEIRKRKDEKKKREADQVRQAIAEENDRYKALPRAEKERILRESLRIMGAWPYYLNRSSPEGSAISEPVRIWQAALFSEFIFEKMSANPRFYPETPFTWVTSRFDLIDNRTADAQVAVKKFLGYLRGCGFLEKSPYNPYEADYYEVVHDKLAPPGKAPSRNVTSKPSAPLVARITQADREAARMAFKEPHWLWRASWPRPIEVLAAANTLLEVSPYKELLLQTIETLSPFGTQSKPLALALRLEAQGVPRDITLDVFVELGLALRALKSAY